MHVLLDHLAATVIGGTVILLLAVLAFRGQETAIDSTQYATAKTRVIDWARMVEQDLNNVGSGLKGADITNGEAFEFTDFEGTGVFSFRIAAAAFASSSDASVTGVGRDGHYAAIGPAGGTRLVCYEREMTGTTVQVLDEDDPAPGDQYETVELFRIVRKEAPESVPGSASNCEGRPVLAQSSPTLTQFQILLRAAPGVPAAADADVREVEVRMRMVSPLGGGRTEAVGGMKQHIDQTRWGRVFRPANLGRTL
jgi:hypothetical protein